MSTGAYAAIDLGAASGRIIVGEVGRETLTLKETHRFANESVPLPDGLHWDIVGLYRAIQTGLGELSGVDSAGIDSWAVDYGLIDDRGALLGLPYHYRDTRTAGLPPWPDPQGLYEITGLAQLPFNTLHQVRAEPPSRLAAGTRLLMIPDLVAYWLTGEAGIERTNASTTQFYDVRTGTWSTALLREIGAPPGLLPPLREPGSTIGRTGPGLTLVAVASHDTASAVAAVPARDERFAYISCGTWSLAGVEVSGPVLTEDARLAGFTNETGVDGTIRFLRNIMGLWLLQECQRVWAEPGLTGLLAEAARAEPFAALVDPFDEVFLSPGDMPARIAAHCAGAAPASRGATVRCILESLALGHRTAIRQAVALSGRDIDTVHLVGGGVHNELLCQFTADACGLPVVAGPVEATALGNVLVQARAAGRAGSLAEMRELVRATQQQKLYTPKDTALWDAAAARVPH